MEDNRRASLVHISVASGVKSLLNGYWEPDTSLQLRGGRVVYVKVNHSDLCIEHYGGRWQLKWRMLIGHPDCLASAEGGCAFEDCSSRMWRLQLAPGSSMQYTDEEVKMRTGDKARCKVSSCHTQLW